MFVSYLFLFFGIVILFHRVSVADGKKHDYCSEWPQAWKATEKEHYCYKKEQKVTFVRYKEGGWWGGRWATKKKYYYARKKVCCEGYGGSRCNTPICNGQASLTTCNRYEGYVEYKNSTSYTCSGGACTEPGKCTMCNRGYYADNSEDDSKCRFCKKIDKCKSPRCSSYSNTQCDWCEGELRRDSKGYNAYTGKPDNTKCQRACSWRSGARCYPGICEGNMVLGSDCRCTTGFEGSNCATANSKRLPIIYKHELALGDGNLALFVPNPSALDEKVWTNQVHWKYVDLKAASKYTREAVGDIDNFMTYINSETIGIKTLKTTASLYRGYSVSKWSEYKSCSYASDCSITVNEKDIGRIPWRGTSGGFLHQDKIIIVIETKNGGKINYIDREANNRVKSYWLKGITATRTLELGFDLKLPDHCFEQRSPCSNDALVTPDFTDKVEFTVSWSGWSDDDSGVEKYQLEMFLLEGKDKLKPKASIEYDNIVYADKSSTTVKMKLPGPHVLEIIAIDRAGNMKKARRILLFDNLSVVDMQPSYTTYVTSADVNTGHVWINKYHAQVEVVWPSRFINKRHNTNGWLNEVEANPSIIRELEDSEGISARTTSKINNVLGVVKFEIASIISFGDNTNPSTNKVFSRVPDKYFNDEKMMVDEELIDGKQVTYYIRGVDAIGEYAEDNTMVKIDLSPPVITNLWLTNTDQVNISVHNLLELNTLTIEWEVYDQHSGLHLVSWRIFDNFTNTDIQHGKAFESPQGDTQTLEECETQYGSYARGHNCYCTPFDGCHHQHYQVKPQVTSTGSDGLHAGSEYGVHESDYYIQINATNRALLTTIVYKKITIDTSPPHEGSVHDGVKGQPEVDFQQSYTLDSHWDGFFDKESGVWFYLYSCDVTCLKAVDLNIHNYDSQKVKKTYLTSASCTVTQSGTYYVTVIAFNHALDPSKPVCSDGVTVDATAAQVSEIVVGKSVTTEGLLKTADNSVWIIRKNRIVEEIVNMELPCLTGASLVSDEVLSTIPVKRLPDGSISVQNSSNLCDRFKEIQGDITSYITMDSHLDVSWNVTHGPSGVHDYEVGLGSQRSNTADKMAFVSSHHHRHIRIVHPNVWDGEEFFIIIKSITKSEVVTYQVVGPFVVDTSKPDFTGRITVQSEMAGESMFLVATWGQDAFIDHGDPHPLQYEFAIGSSALGKDVLPFRPLSTGGSCTSLSPTTCTSINIHSLPWQLHGHQSYYVTLKVTNTVGLSVVASSEEYVHDVILATKGLVYDIAPVPQENYKDIDDIDFQTDMTSLTVRWEGFNHPHLDIVYTVCYGTDTADLTTCTSNIAGTQYTFDGLNLTPYKRYFQAVTAETETGNVTVVSDGVTVVVENDPIDDVQIFDGHPCNNPGTDNQTATWHHSEDTRLKCVEDLDYQSSTNELQAYWTVPSQHTRYLPDANWAIEERAPVIDHWTLFKQYESLKTSFHVKVSDLALTPGRSYRILLQFCAEHHCFKPLHSTGVTIIPNPPAFGGLQLEYSNITKELHVEFNPLFDTDIEDLSESQDVTDHYEWALTDNSDNGRLLMKWQRINVTVTANKVSFETTLPADISFTKCWRVSVKGYTKAGLSSVISETIRDCSDLQQVRPSVVIDAVGKETVASEGVDTTHEGQPVSLVENDNWPEDDKDYTPYHNILSAVWPTLRHKQYTWAVITVRTNDPTIYYQSPSVLELQDPCSHPDAIRCGTTDLGYVNVDFDAGELHHGRRYSVCVHANATQIHHEKWTQDLDSVSTCSDGITVDLTAPVPGNVWIGQNSDQKYQTSTSDITVHWQSFVDVDEEGYSVHTSGITGYEVAVGSTPGGRDVAVFTDVGLTNHNTFHNLRLQSGHSYFATVKGTDFTGLSSQITSQAIKVDTSPPTVTDLPIRIDNRHITSTQFVSACWTSVFVDLESGISHYSWSVGRHPGYDDVMTYTDVTDECGENSPENELSMIEGHAYFVTVKAYNQAGLYASATSWAFTVDASPPVGGHVYDGHVTTGGGAYNDVDYVTSTTSLQAHWEPFHDPHSTVKGYSVRVGSCPGCDDVLVQQPIGIKTDVSLTNLTLVEGLTYYTTITACNTADLCKSSTSDGVLLDSSPPVAGRVMDGMEGTDIQYQASRKYVGCKWYGFTDPQSGLSHYQWWVGTTRGGDNIVPPTDVHLTEEAYIIDLSADLGVTLPVGTRIYSTIRAYNKAGMSAESSSNGFVVDETPPAIIKPLTQSSIGSTATGTSIMRSLLKVEWSIQDNESYIETQYLSIGSHIGGDFNLSSVQVEGIVRDYTFTELVLHDGSSYDVKLISCNGARLCTESFVRNILVDSSPPTPGMFAIDTDHAAALRRQPSAWMTWNSITLNLAWLGFVDVHSGISSYSVNIGSEFMANDLNEVVNSPTVVAHNDSAMHQEDGFVQTHSIRTQSLTDYKHVYISMWATNGVGLRSAIIHAQFSLVYGGIMALVRRCEAETCYGHCICAPHAELCHSDDGNCHVVSNGSEAANVTVKDYLELTFTDDTLMHHTPVSSFLAAKWTVSTSQEVYPKWYEWSVGESEYDSPIGVFDHVENRVWHDAGRDTSWICALPAEQELSEHTKYSFFVRAWYGENIYAIFKSPGVVVFPRRPPTTDIRGKTVKEVLVGGTRDVDYIARDSVVSIDWTDKFLNAHDSLSKYHVYIGTVRGGHDVHIVQTDVAWSASSLEITGLSFEEDTKYYSVVQAYNKAGLHTTEYSDGFMLDVHLPSIGIVKTGNAPREIEAVDSTTTLPAFWFGFSDLDSGIKTYQRCVSSAAEVGRCDVLSMTDVGIATKHKAVYNITANNGDVLYTEVRAVDAFGHVSKHAISQGVVVDVTPPVRANFMKYDSNIVQNPSFEEHDTIDTINSTSENANQINPFSRCDQDAPTEWMRQPGSCSLLVSSNLPNTIVDGASCVYIRGHISQNLSISAFGTYRLTFYTALPPSSDSFILNTEGYVDISNDRHVFLVYQKPSKLSDGHNQLSWQKHTFFFHITTSTVTLNFGTVQSRTSVALDGVRLERSILEDNATATSEGHVKAHTVFVHDWSSLHAEWSFVDEESGVIEFLWAIGTVQGGVQLQDFTSVGRRTFAYVDSLHLIHDTVVHVTVVAINGAGLRTVSYSDPVFIDLTPPVFSYVNDGPVIGTDVHYQQHYNISSNWDATDPDSGVTECYWAIGTQGGGTDIQAFELVPNSILMASTLLTEAATPDGPLYVSVKCTNGAGLTATSVSDGVRIVLAPPATDSVVLDVITVSQTEYQPRDIYHGNLTEVKFRWTGFDRDDGIDSYLVALEGTGVKLSELVVGTITGFTYASFTNLQLADGHYDVSVVAMNKLQMYSQKKTQSVYLLTRPPTLTGSPPVSSWNAASGKLTASWPGVFQSAHPLYYEVTARLAEGGDGDIVQWQETKNTGIEIVMEKDDIPPGGATVRLTVKAISYSGLYTSSSVDTFIHK